MSAQTAFSRLRYRVVPISGMLQFYWSVVQVACSTDSIATDTRNMFIVAHERSDGLRPLSLSLSFDFPNAAILLVSFTNCLQHP